MTQVQLLNSIGMLYSGDIRLKDKAKSHFGELVGFCETEWNIQQISSPSISEGTANDWLVWVEVETHRRVGYCIWVRIPSSPLG